jgi:hypothetical protein
MTKYEKLRKLYEIAVANGYYCKNATFRATIISDFYFINHSEIVCNMIGIPTSIFPHINSYTVGEITFIEALCTATNHQYDWQEIWREWATYPEGTPRPDNLRLDWLFDTFSELLNK